MCMEIKNSGLQCSILHNLQLSIENINVNSQNTMQQTALHIAAEIGNENIVTTLIQSNCDIDIPDFGGFRAIDLAVAHDHSSIVQRLLKCYEERDKKQGKPLSFDITLLVRIAVEHNSPKSLRVLLTSEFPFVLDGEPYTLLHRAAILGFNDIVIVLFEETNITQDLLNKTCAGPNKRHKGATALALAARYAHRDIVNTLLQHNASTACAENTLTIMHHAAAGGDVDILSQLADRNQNKDWSLCETVHGHLPLNMALNVSASEHCISWILEQMNTAYTKSDKERQEKIFKSLTFFNDATRHAVIYASPGSLLNLLNFKFTKNDQNPWSLKKYDRLLHVAIENNRNDMVVVLLKFMKDKECLLQGLSAKNHDGYSGLEYAARKKNRFAARAIADAITSAKKANLWTENAVLRDLDKVAKDYEEFWTSLYSS